MHPQDFHPDQFERGAKYTLDLELSAAGHDLQIPVLLARGARPGKRLVATAGVHGDEYEGVRAIFDIYAELDPAAMTGDFLAVPAANPPAF
ncbi:MAG TPA: succinylglutamate desuccinylase/aspartoacylase family protein, partial [Bryobacteraceae bacterium]|nr:succinylglutamate desuccinylase/aspartoacylase family protein [Bryobacteraceae bacterium]